MLTKLGLLTLKSLDVCSVAECLSLEKAQKNSLQLLCNAGSSAAETFGL